MDHFQIKTEVEKIQKDFGMSGVKVAEAMGVSYAVFRNKKNDNAPEHTFNEKNYNDLVQFISKKTLSFGLKKELVDFGIFLEIQELNSIEKIEKQVDKWLILREQLIT